MFVCCECYVLSDRGLCDELITLPEESYRLWCIVVCDLETSKMRRPWPTLGRSATENKQNKGASTPDVRCQEQWFFFVSSANPLTLSAGVITASLPHDNVTGRKLTNNLYRPIYGTAADKGVLASMCGRIECRDCVCSQVGWACERRVVLWYVDDVTCYMV